MSDETPYRKPSQPCAAIEPSVPTKVERFFAWLLPAFLFSSCRWYRRASGGRWSPSYSSSYGVWYYRGWRRVPFCLPSNGARNSITGCTDNKCICENYDA